VERRTTVQKSNQVQQLKAELSQLLQRPILPSGSKVRYIDSNVANSLNNQNTIAPGCDKRALDDFAFIKKKKKEIHKI
jgi:hypothetical protein